MSTLTKIETNLAPKVVGPYSQAVVAGEFIFCSGQIGIDPETNELVDGIENQTKQVLTNLGQVLKEAGCDFKDVVRTDVFLADISDYAKVNEIYAGFFVSEPKPARQAVAVLGLPKGALVEISCIAKKVEDNE